MHNCRNFSMEQMSHWHRRHFTSVSFAFTIHLALNSLTRKFSDSPRRSVWPVRRFGNKNETKENNPLR